jgi:hypothetical protein
MQDGKIVREDIIGSPDEEDLKMWRHSNLGKQILAGTELHLLEEKLSSSELKAVKKALSVANGKS